MVPLARMSSRPCPLSFPFRGNPPGPGAQADLHQALSESLNFPPRAASTGITSVVLQTVTTVTPTPRAAPKGGTGCTCAPHCLVQGTNNVVWECLWMTGWKEGQKEGRKSIVGSAWCMIFSRSSEKRKVAMVTQGQL